MATPRDTPIHQNGHSTETADTPFRLEWLLCGTRRHGCRPVGRLRNQGLTYADWARQDGGTGALIGLKQFELVSRRTLEIVRRKLRTGLV